MPLKWESSRCFWALEVGEPCFVDDATTDHGDSLTRTIHAPDAFSPRATFLDLPPEIRDMIYRHVLVPFHPIELAPITCHDMPHPESCFGGQSIAPAPGHWPVFVSTQEYDSHPWGG